VGIVGFLVDSLSCQSSRGGLTFVVIPNKNRKNAQEQKLPYITSSNDFENSFYCHKQKKYLLLNLFSQQKELLILFDSRKRKKKREKMTCQQSEVQS
jgi:hypothetical protein